MLRIKPGANFRTEGRIQAFPLRPKAGPIIGIKLSAMEAGRCLKSRSSLQFESYRML